MKIITSRLIGCRTVVHIALAVGFLAITLPSHSANNGNNNGRSNNDIQGPTPGKLAPKRTPRPLKISQNKPMSPHKHLVVSHGPVKPPEEFSTGPQHDVNFEGEN